MAKKNPDLFLRKVKIKIITFFLKSFSCLLQKFVLKDIQCEIKK